MKMIRNLSLLSCWATFLFLLGIGIVGFTSAQSPLLFYKYTTSFQRNNVKVNYWTPIDKNKNFFPLGDLASTNYPTETAMMVRDDNDGLVAPPTSLTEMGKSGVFVVLSLDAPAGFTCIGNLVVWGSDKPDKNKYRCLRSDLVTPGDSTLHVRLGGISIWKSLPDPSNSGAGLATGTFVFSKSPTAKPSSTFVVKSKIANMENVAPPIVYNYIRLFEKSFIGMSGIWTPIDPKRNYFALGDITNTTGTTFTNKAMMVLDNKDESVAAPTGLNEISKNEDIVVFELIAPEGYTCIGNVAIKPSTAGTLPDINNYRCLSYEMVTFGNTTRFWNKGGVSLWNVIPNPHKPGGLETGTFAFTNNATQKPLDPLVVDSAMMKNYVHVPPPVLLVYKYTELFKQINQNLSIWTPMDENKDYFPLGDLVTASKIYPTETAMMVLDSKNGLVEPPASITEIWGEKELGFFVYKLNPPAGYTCIGNVAILNADPNFKPDKNNYRCLRSDLVTRSDSTLSFENSVLSLNFWSAIPNPSESEAGLETGTFVFSKSPTAKPSSTFVVNSKFTFEEYNPRPALVYKQAKAYSVSFRGPKQKATNKEEDFSIWRPIDYFNRGYYALGDVYTIGNDYPDNVNAMMVQDNGDGLVAPPESLSEWFQNKELGGSFWTLNPPPGYTCMGMVVTSESQVQPKEDQFRCLRSDLVTPAEAQLKWTYHYKGKSLWNIIADSTRNEPVLETGCFILYNNPREKDPDWETFVVLANRTTDVDPKYEVKNPKDISLVLYETLNVDWIWNDRESGGKYDVSIWRAKECCNLGDTAIQGYDKFATFMVKDLSPNSDALKKPDTFEYVYDNYPSEAEPLSIWKPKCPQNYVALGYVANRARTMPSIDGNFRCVNKTITTTGGQWTWVYTDEKSGAKRDTTIWRADPTIPGNSVGVWAMSAVAKQGNMDITKPSFLDAARVSLRFQKPIRSVKVKNFFYDYANQVVVSQGPSEITKGNRLKVANCPGNSEATSEMKVSYSTTTETSFEWSLGLEVGVSYQVEATAVVATVTKGVSFTFSSSVTSSASTTNTSSSEFLINTPTLAGYRDTYYVKGTKFVANIPYTAEVHTTYTDDTTTVGWTSGVMSDQSYSEIEFVREEPEYCGKPTTEAPPTSG